MMDALYVVLGLVALVVAANFLVKGASSLASRFGVSPLVVGLTVVSFGTSMPEMFVSVTSGLQGNAELAVANVIGSNIFNVLVVLGVAAIICPLPVQNSTVVSEIPFSLTAALLVGFLANAALFSDTHELSISRVDGLILLSFFFLFMLYIFGFSNADSDDAPAPDNSQSMARSLFNIGIGGVGLYLGGQWVVSGAVGLARSWAVDDAMIGLTIVAIGTSLPELVASAVAAYRKEADIAVGNVVGSNIFNLLWILGVTATITELPFRMISNTDLVMVIISSMLILLALAAGRTTTISRGFGIFFVCMYLAYFAYVIQRG